MNDKENIDWYEEELEEGPLHNFKAYDVTSTPNDFNTKTIIDFIESGLFKIPGFQRNYVWDIKRASRLIESIIIGLPIPQVFLYEEGRNNYLVIDGQQRLLTIYFFSKKRFPKKEKRFELRQVFNINSGFPESYLYDDNFFDDFKLTLNEPNRSQTNELHGLNYSTLNDLKSVFDLRTIRNIMIKQNFPDNDDSAMYEIFNRLNSGGVTLTPQEIRTSLYHSMFYNCLYDLNLNESWRSLLGKAKPDIHMKDVEMLLRGFAMILKSEEYRPPMTRFLNQFSKHAKEFKDSYLEYLKKIFVMFCDYILSIDKNVFMSASGKFNVTVFESIFVALCRDSIKNEQYLVLPTSKGRIDRLKENREFVQASQSNTAGKSNVSDRLNIARRILTESLTDGEDNH